MLQLALLPCENVTFGAGVTVADDGNGNADGLGTTDTGAAFILTVNGESYENVDDEWPDTVRSKGPAGVRGHQRRAGLRRASCAHR